MGRMVTVEQPEGSSWWRAAVFYQVYPRSFADSNQDGVGDLPGITARLDYLAELGVDAIWLSPFYPSPGVDGGYDVSDHRDVDPTLGTLADADVLLAQAHARGIRVVVDFVANHTSERHPWFVESRGSRANPKRDWYLWRDGKRDGAPPNNWRSVFGGPAWSLDPRTGQYYYHAYLAEQPDLNWRNPQVRRAMLRVLRFWLRRGVDGFRIDALRHLIKDDRWRDNPPNPGYRAGGNPYDALLPVYSADRPEIHQVVAAIRRVLDDADGERVMVGELYLPIDRLVRYYGQHGRGVHLPSNMHLLSTPYRAEQIAALIDRYEAALPEGAWPNWVLGNHDRHRIATRVGGEQARVAAMLLLTLRGTPTLYYGDELGMRDVPIPAGRLRDAFERNVPGIGVGRDPERTPMQWDASPNAGFCPQGVQPWLPVADDYRTVNVAAQARDPGSMLSLYRRLIALRHRERALAVGCYRLAFAGGDLLAYAREHAGRRLLVALNLGRQPQVLDLGPRGLSGVIRLGTRLGREGEQIRGALALRGDEGAIIELGRPHDAGGVPWRSLEPSPVPPTPR
jgi:alpha-glucosidase